MLFWIVNRVVCTIYKPMRSIKFAFESIHLSGWDGAVLLTEAYLSNNAKADELLSSLPDGYKGQRRATCQSLFLGALRHGHCIRHAFRPHLRRTPPPRLEAVLLVAGYEILREPPEKHPKVVHHAVERGKQLLRAPEVRFLNAVLRKLPDALAKIDPYKEPGAWFSHPDWLVRRWEASFGRDATRKFLEWNQRIPSTYIRFARTDAEPPEGARPTPWPGFYRITAAALSSEQIVQQLKNGEAYIKDPATRLAPDLLAPKAGELVLDLCAAPGGKAFDLANQMDRKGALIAVDLPGSRIERLRENLKPLETRDFNCHIVPADVLTLASTELAARQLPETSDAVMLDAPCSNTGVIQRHPDIKWRLQPDDIENRARLQKELLASAARLVRPGGRLVYSTCSIEARENRAVVEAFLASREGETFSLTELIESLPWETGHDGASAFLLQKHVS
ncbi:MAG: RsmB/NOP family class I SAM-dependent RNA methyltransferase [Opitutales bacterium]